MNQSTTLTQETIMTNSINSKYGTDTSLKSLTNDDGFNQDVKAMIKAFRQTHGLGWMMVNTILVILKAKTVGDLTSYYK